MALFIGLACFLTSLFLCRLYQLSLSSPTVLFALLYTAMAFGGLYFYDPEPSLVAAIGDAETTDKANTFIWINLNILCLVVSTCGAIHFLANYQYAAKINPLLSSSPFEASFGLVILFTASALMCFVVGSGVLDLFLRHEYMVEQNKSLKSIGGLSCMLSGFALGLIRHRSIAQRLVVVFALYILALVFLGYSSRSFAVVLVLYAVAKHASINSSRTAIALALILVLSPTLLALPLVLRGEQTQGLIPLFQRPTYFVVEALRSGYSDMLDNFLLSAFQITQMTRFAQDIDAGYLLTAVNPMPGAFTDFYSFNTGLNPYIPYSSMGEWLAFSPLAALVFYSFLGFFFGYIECLAKSTSPLFATIARLPLILYSLLSLQYTTRASLRPIVYLALFMLARLAYFKLKSR